MTEWYLEPEVWSRISRRLWTMALLAGFSSGSIVAFVMWLAIQVFHP